MERAVLFATPAFEKSVSVDFHISMLDTVIECVKHRIPFAHRQVAGNQFIDVARNKLVHYFLTSPEKFTDLIFIDSDQGWDAKVIPRILSYSQGVVAGLPPKKEEEPTYHDNAVTGIIKDGLFQALEAGTGFMRIRREIFEQMDAAYPELKEMVEPVNGWPDTPYFQRGNTKYGGFLGEDIFFCRQLIAMGEYVWIDSDMTFTHRGSKVWTGNLYEHYVAKGLLKRSA